MRKTHAPKLLLALLILAGIAAFSTLDLERYFSLEYFKSQQDEFARHYSTYPARSLAIFFGIYVVTTALSFPGAAVLTLIAGALFGFFTGLAIVSFASTIGATLAFLTARFLLRGWIQRKFGGKLGNINRGIEREGAFYLFTLRLVPVFPFFLVNLIMGLTPIHPWTYYWVSQLGMLLGTAVYVNAGTQLAAIESPKGLLTGGLLASFGAIGLLPLVSKRMLETYAKRLRLRRNGANQSEGKS